MATTPFGVLTHHKGKFEAGLGHAFHDFFGRAPPGSFRFAMMPCRM
jgi:hypothetical protein